MAEKAKKAVAGGMTEKEQAAYDETTAIGNGDMKAAEEVAEEPEEAKEEVVEEVAEEAAEEPAEK